MERNILKKRFDAVRFGQIFCGNVVHVRVEVKELRLRLRKYKNEMGKILLWKDLFFFKASPSKTIPSQPNFMKFLIFWWSVPSGFFKTSSL